MLFEALRTFVLVALQLFLDFANMLGVAGVICGLGAACMLLLVAVWPKDKVTRYGIAGIILALVSGGIGKYVDPSGLSWGWWIAQCVIGLPAVYFTVVAAEAFYNAHIRPIGNAITAFVTVSNSEPLYNGSIWDFLREHWGLVLLAASGIGFWAM